MTPVPRPKTYDGPPILSYGFRPFFLFGAIYSAAAIAIWLPRYFGELTFVTFLSPLAWHTHEMLFGFVVAVITGFLLTAIPNWTGRLPLQGGPLLILLIIWLTGRMAIVFAAVIGWLPAMAMDCAFLAAVTAAVAREIVAGKNWRNLKILGLLTLLLASNAGFHIEAHVTGTATYAERSSIALVLILVMLIGGRIVPSFTHNWLVRANPGRLPPSSGGGLDMAIMAITIAALSAWVIVPDSNFTAVFSLMAGVGQAVRMARWGGWRAWREPLVMVLHVAYGFVPIGFALSAASAFFPDAVPSSAGVHAWTAGAMGGMILAVMTRASLGHTGRMLHADRLTNFIYAAIFIAALIRIIAALVPHQAAPLLIASSLAWSAAFLGFAVFYGPYLMRPRV